MAHVLAPRRMCWHRVKLSEVAKPVDMPRLRGNIHASIQVTPQRHRPAGKQTSKRRRAARRPRRGRRALARDSHCACTAPRTCRHRALARDSHCDCKAHGCYRPRPRYSASTPTCSNTLLPQHCGRCRSKSRHAMSTPAPSLCSPAAAATPAAMALACNTTLHTPACNNALLPQHCRRCRRQSRNVYTRPVTLLPHCGRNPCYLTTKGSHNAGI